jgi:hypothetical protein
MKTLEENDLMEVVWQMPTITIPYGVSNKVKILFRNQSS